jgi:hypothetical protein
VFNYWFPKMTPVMVFRDPVQAVETHVRRRTSAKRTPGDVRASAAKIVDARYKFMENILAKRGDAYRVDADRVVVGDLEQIIPIMEDYGVRLDHRLAMEGISPAMFHR